MHKGQWHYWVVTVAGFLALLTVLLLGAALRARHEDRQQKRAIQALAAAGATVTVGTQYIDWANSVVVYSVDLSGTQLTDAGLRALLPHLRSLQLTQLNLTDTQVTDVGLALLADLQACRLLATVDTTRTPVTPAGRAQLREKLPSVSLLDSAGTRAFYFSDCEDLLFSGDGLLLAGISRLETVVWNTETGQRVARLIGGTSGAFSADGGLLAICRPEGATILDVATQGDLITLPLGARSPQSASFDTNARHLYVAESNDVLQYDAADGRLVNSRGGHRLLLGRSRTLNWPETKAKAVSMVHPDWGPRNGHCPNADSTERLEAVNAEGTTGAWKPAHDARTVHVVDLETGQTLQRFPYPANGDGLTVGGFDRAGDRLALIGDGGALQVYEVATGRLLFSEQDTAGYISVGALSPDGQMVAAAFSGGLVKWWPISMHPTLSPSAGTAAPTPH